MRSASGSPSSSSIMIKCSDPCCSIPWMVQMLGWFSEDAARASRWKRCRSVSSLAIAGERNFSDVAAEARILGFVHYSHPAFAELGRDAVVRNGIPDHNRIPLCLNLRIAGEREW